MALFNMCTFMILMTLTMASFTSRGSDEEKLPKPPKAIGSSGTCGRLPHLNTIPRMIIANESLVPYGQLPWHVAIFYRPDNSFLCSGTLVSKQHVLTSAFCLLTINADSRIEIRLGDWDIKNDIPSMGEPYPHLSASISKVMLYPETSPLDRQMKVPTIALLRLTEPVNYLDYPQVAPICIPTKNDKLKFMAKQWLREDTANNDCFVSGWGYQMPDALSAKSDKIRKEYNDDEPFLSQRYEYNVDSMSKASVDSFVPVERKSKPSEPISITIPMFPSPYQQALYRGSNSDEKNVVGEPSLNPMEGAKFSLLTGTLIRMEDTPDQIRKTKNPDPVDEYDYEETENVVAPPKSRDDLSTLLDTIFDTPASKETVYDNSTIYTASTSQDSSRVSLTAEQKAFQEQEMESVEATMNRHKQKYNIGKKQGAIIRVKLEADMKAQMKEDQDGEHGIRKREINGAADPSGLPPTERPPQPISSSILKWVDVRIEEICSIIPDDGLAISPVGKSCIVPTRKDKVVPFCLVDLGSPVTCIDTGKTKQSSAEGRSGEKRARPRGYLGGVITWKRPCFVDDNDPSVNVTLVASTHNFLAFLKKHIKGY